MLDSLVFDLRFGLRSLLRRPGFLTVAALTLALGIGANATIFTVIRGVLLRPLPFEEPERLVRFERNQSPPNLADLRQREASLSAVAGYALWGFDLLPRSDADRPERIDGAMVTEGFFAVLGAEPAQGRLFSTTEHQEGGTRTAVVSHGFWQRHLGADPSAVGSEINLSGRSAVVLGVLEPGFRFPEAEAEIWMPLAVEYAVALPARNAHFLRSLGRLGPGLSLEAARGELELSAAALEAEHPKDNEGLSFAVTPLSEHLVGNVRQPLLLLMGAVAVVLLIAWVNVATLVLSRSAGRGRELAVRSACGADRRRLLRQLLVESLILGGVGGVLGLLLSVWTVDGLVALGGFDLPRLEEIRLDGTVLALAAMLALATSIAAGLLPAWRTVRDDLQGALWAGAAAATGRSQSHLRNTLVVVEVAAALVLLTGAGLLMRSFAEVLEVDPGFETRGVQTLRLDLPEARYTEIPEQTAFLNRVLTELGETPGLSRVGLISELPLDSGRLSHDFEVEGRTIGQEQSLRAWAREISGGYFDTLGIHLLEGRTFDSRDRAGSPAVAVVNQSLARALWPDESALGRRLRWIGAGEYPWMTVVGVAEDIRQFGFEQREGGAIYTSFRQKPMEWKRWTSVVAASPLAPSRAAAAMSEAIWRADSNLPVTRVRSLESWVAEGLAGRRFSLALLGLFAGLAVSLAAVGVYGLLAFSVAVRRREIGIRLALGAHPRRLLASLLGRTAALVALALVLGLPMAALASRGIASMLYQVSPTDPGVYAAVAALVFVVALVAAWLPARRVLRVDPVTALREE